MNDQTQQFEKKKEALEYATISIILMKSTSTPR